MDYRKSCTAMVLSREDFDDMIKSLDKDGDGTVERVPPPGITLTLARGARDEMDQSRRALC